MAQGDIKDRLARLARRKQGDENDHARGQGSRDIRGRLADILGKARAENNERDETHAWELEQQMDEERKPQRELDRDLGWEFWTCNGTQTRP